MSQTGTSPIESAPPSPVVHTLRDGSLHPTDAQMFSNILYTALVATSIVTSTDDITVAQMRDLYHDPLAEAKLRALVRDMYHLWDNNPCGRSVYGLLVQIASFTLSPSEVAFVRSDACRWRIHYLQPKPEETFILVTETDTGSIVTDDHCTRFYKVVGLAPATDDVTRGHHLPCRVHFSALPFRNVLVKICDFTVCAANPLTNTQLQTVLAKLARANEQNEIISRLVADSPPIMNIFPSIQTLRAMDEERLKDVVLSRILVCEDRDSLLREVEFMREVSPLAENVANSALEREDPRWNTTVEDRKLRWLRPAADGALCGEERLLRYLLKHKRKTAQKLVEFNNTGLPRDERATRRDVKVVMIDFDVRGPFSTISTLPVPLEEPLATILLHEFLKFEIRGAVPGVIVVRDSVVGTMLMRIIRGTGISLVM